MKDFCIYQAKINLTLIIYSGQKCKVVEWDEEVEIIGINEYGYLRVKKNDNLEYLLQPDGNRYDMMHNLLVLRT